MFSIVYGLKKFQHLLLGSQFTATARSDHQSLRYFFTQEHIESMRVARWMDYLGMFDFDITYIEGKANLVADALSRLPRATMQISTLASSAASPAAAPPPLFLVSSISTSAPGLSEVHSALENDEWSSEVREK